MEMSVSLLVIAVLFVTGWVLGSLRFPGPHFWQKVDGLLYFLLLPIVLIRSAFKADISLVQSLPMGLATVCAIVTLTIVLCLGRHFIASNGAAFSSVIQGAVRVNVYAGFAIAAVAYGERGVALFSIVIAFAIPVDNVLSIVALNVFASPTKSSLPVLIRQIILNPLILSLITGHVLHACRVDVGGYLLAVMDLLAGATLPLAILTVGAGFKFEAIQLTIRPLLVAVLARQVALPAIAMGASYLFGLNEHERATVLLHATLPTGPAAYAVAKQMGGDARLMARIIAATTIFAFISVPIAMLVSATR